MKPDPILEELWATKDRLALEAGYDAHRFVERLRRWEVEHPDTGSVGGPTGDPAQLVAGKVL